MLSNADFMELLRFILFIMLEKEIRRLYVILKLISAYLTMIE